MRRRTEDKLHRSIWKQLCVLLPHDCEAWSVENRNLGIVVGRQNKARGCKAGVPDMHFLHNGRLLCVELKAGRTRVSDTQKDMHDRIRFCGGTVQACRSLDEVVTFLTEQGVRLKGALQ